MMRVLMVLAWLGLIALPASADDGIDCNGAMTTQFEMTYCAGKAYDDADKELNRIWPQIRKAMKQRDVDLGEPWNQSWDLLLEAQRAWITFRDAHCSGYAMIAAGGTAQPMMGSECRADLTRKRIEELKSLIQG